MMLKKIFWGHAKHLVIKGTNNTVTTKTKIHKIYTMPGMADVFLFQCSLYGAFQVLVHYF